jgi:hypothetical protein
VWFAKFPPGITFLGEREANEKEGNVNRKKKLGDIDKIKMLSTSY